MLLSHTFVLLQCGNEFQNISEMNLSFFCFRQSFTLLPFYYVTAQNSLNQLSKLHDYYIGYVITTTFFFFFFFGRGLQLHFDSHLSCH